MIRRLAPFGGLDGRRYLDEAAPASPIPMRGGYNVELVDGEWWTRAGRELVNRTIGNVPWQWIIPDESGSAARALLVSPWYALRCRLSDGGVDNIYSPAVTENIAFTNGSASATSSTTRNAHELVLVGGGTGFTTECYRILAVSGTSVTLDRAYESTNGAKSCRLLTPFETPFSITPSGDGPNGGCVIFDQLVSHTGTTLGYSNPAVTRGHQYLVITSPLLVSGIIAIDLTTDTAPLRDFLRLTNLASPTAPSSPPDYVTVFQNRLVVAGMADPDGNYADRTLYYSQIGDLLLFHTGVQGKTSSPNYVTLDDVKNPINGLGTLGQRLVVHRRYSQVVGAPTGSNAQPFQFVENKQGYGLEESGTLVDANGAHYFMSLEGPAMFDGGQVRPLAASLRQHLDAMLDWGSCKCAFEDSRDQRIYWVFDADGDSGKRHQSATLPATETLEVPHPSSTPDYTSVTTVLVHDYLQDAWWLEDHVNIACGGTISGRAYVSRYDGTLVSFRVDSGSGLDSDISFGDADYPVDCLVESPWIDFGTFETKMITKLYVMLRALDLTTGGNPSVNDYWTDPAQTLHLCTIEILIDDNPATVMQALDCNALTSAMLALTPDENQQMPIMVHEKSPRVSGRSFKFRVKNALSADATTASHKKAAFRLAGIEVHYEQSESDQSLRAFNA